MSRQIVVLAMAVISTGPFWAVSFTPHKDNVGVVAVTECAGGKYSAYLRTDVSGEDASAMIRRVIPHERNCRVTFELLRGRPGEESVADSTTMDLD